MKFDESMQPRSFGNPLDYGVDCAHVTIREVTLLVAVFAVAQNGEKRVGWKVVYVEGTRYRDLGRLRW